METLEAFGFLCQWPEQWTMLISSSLWSAHVVLSLLEAKARVEPKSAVSRNASRVSVKFCIHLFCGNLPHIVLCSQSRILIVVPRAIDSTVAVCCNRLASQLFPQLQAKHTLFQSLDNCCCVPLHCRRLNVDYERCRQEILCHRFGSFPGISSQQYLPPLRRSILGY